MSGKIIATCLFAFATGTALIFSGVSPPEVVHEVSGPLVGCRNLTQRTAIRTYSVIIAAEPPELRIQFDGAVIGDVESRFLSACKARGQMRFFFSKSRMSILDSYWIQGMERANGEKIFSARKKGNNYFLIFFGVLMYGFTFEAYRKGRAAALASSSRAGPAQT